MSGFYFSYDTWVSTSDVVDEPQDEPVHQGPWEVYTVISAT